MNTNGQTPEKSLLEVLRRRWRVVSVTASLGCIALGVGLYFVHPEYVGVAHVLLVNEASGRDPSTASADLPAIATSSEVIDRVRQELHLKGDVNEMRKRLSAHVAPHESIMTISYRAGNPSLAISVTNATANAFAKYYGDLTTWRYRGIASQLRRDLSSEKRRIAGMERQIQMTAATTTYNGSQRSLDDVAKRLGDLETQRALAYAQLVSDDAELSVDRGEPGHLAKIARHEMLENNPTYKDIRTDTAKDAALLADVKAGYTSIYPGLPGLQEKVREERATLDRVATQTVHDPDAYSPSLASQQFETEKQSAVVAGDKSRFAALDREIAQVRNQLARPPADALSIGALNALRNAAEAQYQALALRLSQVEGDRAESNSLGSIEVVDLATEGERSMLGPFGLLVVGLLAVIAVAIGAAYAAESLDRRFITVRDIESFYGRSVITLLGKS